MLGVRPGRALAILMLTLGAAAPAARAQLPTHPLLPLARGALLVSMGDPPQWTPISGTPLTLTVFSGRSSLRSTKDVNAYIALQSDVVRCATSAKRAHARPLHEIADFFSPGNLVSRRESLFAPSGGAAAGDYAAGLPNVVVRQRTAVRVCVWLTTKPSRKVRPFHQDIPILNGLFAASVSALPSAAPTIDDAYTFDAVAVDQSFSYAVSSTQCGVTSNSAAQVVQDGTLATESITFGNSSCTTDASTFSFTSAGRSLGALTYTLSDALLSPPLVATLGGCELDPIAVTQVAVANQYVQAVGCEVGRYLIAPFQKGLPRGAVLEAQVDGGLAEVAPRGTVVDLVLNGRT